MAGSKPGLMATRAGGKVRRQGSNAGLAGWRQGPKSNQAGWPAPSRVAGNEASKREGPIGKAFAVRQEGLAARLGARRPQLTAPIRSPVGPTPLLNTIIKTIKPKRTMRSEVKVVGTSERTSSPRSSPLKRSTTNLSRPEPSR